MLLEAIYHRPKSNFSYAYDRDTLHIRLRTKKNDVDSVCVLYGDKYFRDKWIDMSKQSDMYIIAQDKYFDYWQVEIKPDFKRVSYCFGLVSGEEGMWMNEKGFYREKPQNTSGLFEFPFINAEDIFTTPDWVKDSIFYQIFPERFENGDRSNDPEGIEPWGGNPTHRSFYGGDLQGVIQRLDYLSELGVNAIYFTPIFEAPSNHKYDTRDYFKIDPHFGDTAKLKELVNLCHERGIRVILDAVFNHSGFLFEPFQDVLKKGITSKYKDWFHIMEFPVKTEPAHNYHSFSFSLKMPKLNTGNKDVKEYLLKAARYWIEETDIDGWRLDVANEVDHSFWREFRRVVKEAKPDAYIVGEIWHDSTPWLQGDQFDAVMNYPFTDAVLNFFAHRNINAEDFSERLGNLFASYPLQANEAAFNLLDSHDTARLLNMCHENRDRMRLAVLFQLTYGGVPCIYYGDEVGMTGGNDPDCRRTMVWEEEKQDREMFDFYRRLISLRRMHPALRVGSFRIVKAQGEILIYERKINKEVFYIAINNSEEEREIEIEELRGRRVKDVMEEENYQLFHDKLALLPHDYKIYMQE